MVHMSQICFNIKLNMCIHSVLVSTFIIFQITKIENLHCSRTKQVSNMKILFKTKMTYMYIMCLPSLLPVSKITKICHYIEDMWGKFYRQYHRLTSTETYEICRRNLTFS